METIQKCFALGIRYRDKQIRHRLCSQWGKAGDKKQTDKKTKQEFVQEGARGQGGQKMGAFGPRSEICEAAQHPRARRGENIPGRRKSESKLGEGKQTEGDVSGAGWSGEGSLGAEEGRLAGQVTGHRSQVTGPHRPDQGAVHFIPCFCSDSIAHG